MDSPSSDASVFKPRKKSARRPFSMSMMRVAIAGTGGLAQEIAHCIQEETSHQVVLLSRSSQPELASRGLQVLPVTYSDPSSLHYALLGIDTVISTVTGPNQRELIHAAIRARVRRFASAEFEGPPDLRPQNDPLDRERSSSRAWLAHFARHIQSTSFVCGIFYQRFQPRGLQRDNIGLSTGMAGEGDYILNIRNRTAHAPIYDSRNLPTVTVSMTSVQDVARFVTRALEIQQWRPGSEMHIQGERMTVQYLVNGVQRLMQRTFNVQELNPRQLTTALRTAQSNENIAQQARINAMISTAAGRYDVMASPNSDVVDLNVEFPDLQVVSFWRWLATEWNIQVPDLSASTGAGS